MILWTSYAAGSSSLERPRCNNKHVLVLDNGEQYINIKRYQEMFLQADLCSTGKGWSVGV